MLEHLMPWSEELEDVPVDYAQQLRNRLQPLERLIVICSDEARATLESGLSTEEIAKIIFGVRVPFETQPGRRHT